MSVLVRAVLANTELDLWNAAKDGELNKVNQALSTGTDVNWVNPDNKWKATVIHMASGFNHPAIVRALLDAGADKDVKNNEGETPIWIASYWGYSHVTTLLAAQGADVNIPSNNGATPIIAATDQGHLSAVEALIVAQADLTLSNNNGWTALHAAAWKNESNIAQLLLQAGAENKKQDTSGRTPGDVARQHGNIKLGDVIDNFIRITTQSPATTDNKVPFIITGIVCGIIVFIVIISYVIVRCISARRHANAHPQHRVEEHVHNKNSLNDTEAHIYETVDDI